MKDLVWGSRTCRKGRLGEPPDSPSLPGPKATPQEKGAQGTESVPPVLKVPFLTWLPGGSRAGAPPGPGVARKVCLGREGLGQEEALPPLCGLSESIRPHFWVG